MKWAAIKNRLAIFLHDLSRSNRLRGAIASASSECEEARQNGATKKTDWYRHACRYLEQAENDFREGDLHQAWAAVAACERALLWNPKASEKVKNAALALRLELGKISGWRSKAITELICDPKGKLRANIASPKLRGSVIYAIELRDDYFQTTYFKIMMRRRHLIRLSFVLVIGILTVLGLSFAKVLPAPFDDPWLVAAVALFGALGAALSVARGLLVTDVSARIPDQEIGAFLIWMRPAVGAVAALISLVLVHAKAIQIFEWKMGSFAVELTVAIVAGFSERFIVGAIEQVAEKGGKKKADKDQDRA